MPERLEDVAVNVIGPPLPAHLLDDHSGDGVSEVGVLPAHRGRERRLPVGVEPLELVGRRELVRHPMVAGLALEPGAVRQQLLDGDRPVVVARGLGLEPGQVFLDRIIEAQLALLAQLHDGDRREQLAVRCHAKLRRRRHRDLRLDVREAESPGPDELLVAHHADGDAGESAIGDLPLHPRRKEALGSQDVGVIGVIRTGDHILSRQWQHECTDEHHQT